LLIGFFLPGDTLLFTAGFFSAQGKLPALPIVIAAIVLAAIIGDNVGYQLGRRTGHKIFTKKDGYFFRQEYIQRAEAFYEKHGGKTIILARH
jgi:membrane-associated protein